MNEAQTALRATERARAGLTVPLSRIFAALVGHNSPARLARKFQADTRPFVAALDEERPQWQRVGQPWMASSSHDVVADHLDEADDPRADIVRQRIHESGPGGGINHLGALAKAAGTGTGLILEALADQRVFRTAEQNALVVPHPDAGRTAVVRIRPQGREPVYHVRTDLESGRGTYHTAMTHAEFTKWRDSMEPEERAKFLFPDEQPSTAPPHPDSVDANVRMKNTHLARAGDAITYVGGRVPGGQRAQGFWTGGTEQSSVVRVPSQFVDRAAVDIARHNGQKSALWFKPGAGSDVLHVLQFNGGYPRSLSKILKKHGVTEFTITQNPVSVHVVDKGGILSGAVRAAAAESGAQYAPQSGTAGYADLQTKLARKRDTDPRARAQELNAFLRAAHYNGYQISDLHPFADWLREVTGNPDDPRAHVVQNHTNERNPRHSVYGYHGVNVNASLFASAKNRPSGLVLSFLHPRVWNNGPVDGTAPAAYARVEWAVPHPGARNPGSDRVFRTLMNDVQLHEFIDKLPEPHQAEWRAHAANHGMIDNREKNPPPV